jgi:hypothetical protein
MMMMMKYKFKQNTTTQRQRSVPGILYSDMEHYIYSSTTEH